MHNPRRTLIMALHVLHAGIVCTNFGSVQLEMNTKALHCMIEYNINEKQCKADSYTDEVEGMTKM